MLFGYPIEATNENWFHECLIAILQTIHSSLRNGQIPPAWPEIIPEPQREILKKREGLMERLNAYHTAAANLDNVELDQVNIALSEQNEIENLLTGLCYCETINDLPMSIRQPARDLFEFGFKLLTDLGIRDRQYEAIYSSMPYQVCPFCGCEYFDAPGAPREPLDHYLPESRYPFAAANLRNLVPMGNKCNSKYKLAQDILFREDGTRRRSIFPYNHNDGIRISLERSEPFTGAKEPFPTPLWRIDFEPDSEEVTTWDTVFHIRERYERDVLRINYRRWLQHFSDWCHSYNVRPVSEQDVINALDRYSSFMRAMGMDDRAFLKAAMFQMLCHHCQQGDQRLIAVLINVATGVVIND